MFLNGMRGGGVLACLVCGAAAIIACGPERRGADDDPPDQPDVPWLMGVFTQHAVGDNFPSSDANVFEFRGGGEAVVWRTGVYRTGPGEPNLKWEAQTPTRVRVEPLVGRGATPFIVAPTSDCNELRRSDIVNGIEPTDAEFRTPLYRGELCVTSIPEAIGGAFNFDYCDGPPPPCDEQPD